MERNTWYSVKSLLPESEELVFVSNGKGWTSLACRIELNDDVNTGETWCWCEALYRPCEENKRIVADCEQRDLDVQYWHRLPNPPKV